MKILHTINQLPNKQKLQPLTLPQKQQQHPFPQHYLTIIPPQLLTTFSTIKLLHPIPHHLTPHKLYHLPQQYPYIQN
nr:DUF896 domain-containing protein [Staphylococcus aureus]